MECKKIVLITSEFPPLPGGIGNHAYLVSKYLQKVGYDIAVMSDFRSKKEDEAFDAQQDFRIYRINRNKFTQLNRIKKALVFAKQKDIILCSGKFSLWLGGFLKCMYPKKKYIAVLHGSEIRAGGKIGKILTSWSLKRFHKIIAVSNFTKNKALKYNPKLKIEVINNGFVLPENETVTSNSKILGQPKIVTVGNVTNRKGQHNVIQALPLLKEKFPDIHYHCMGIPTEKKAFTMLAEKLKVQNNITFHGAVSSNDLVFILKQSDVFFMLSDVLKNGDFEGFGIAILEANSLGIPAIGSNNSGIVDAIKIGFSGELVNPKNEEEITEAFLKIMQNYDAYSKNAVQWATNFTWDTIGKQYLEVLAK